MQTEHSMNIEEQADHGLCVCFLQPFSLLIDRVDY